jgi:hypothetical protein
VRTYVPCDVAGISLRSPPPSPRPGQHARSDVRCRGARPRWPRRRARAPPTPRRRPGPGTVRARCEGQAVLALLAMLSGPRRPQASCALAQLCDRSGMLPIAEILLRQARHPV